MVYILQDNYVHYWQLTLSKQTVNLCTNSLQFCYIRLAIASLAYHPTIHRHYITGTLDTVKLVKNLSMGIGEDL